MNYNIYTLNNLPLMQKGKIEQINCDKIIKRRLLDLGLTYGSFIVPMLSSASGGLRAFNIRGSLIAIRDEDASSILVSF